MKRALTLLATTVALLALAAPTASAVPVCPATTHACGCGVFYPGYPGYPVVPLRSTACIIA